MTELTKTFRDQFLSVYQSAAAEYARKGEAEASLESSVGPATSPESLMAAADRVAELHAQELTIHLDTAAPAEAEVELEGVPDIAGKCAALGLQLLQAAAFGDKATAKRLKDELALGTCDPRWADTLIQFADYFGLDGTRGKIPYVTAVQAGEKVIRIKPNSRIGLVGDWGTGAGPAVQVLEQLEAQQPDIVIHLGDIYYSGTDTECRENFEAIVNKVLRRHQSKIPVYTLAGNHDMYSGGHGYYDLLKRLNAGDQTQPASFFCLRASDDSWQLLGMDTGLHDYSPVSVNDVVTFVEADEQAWHKRRIAEFAGKSILLSHHQLFSRYSSIGEKDRSGRYVPYNKRLKTMFDDFLSIGKPIPAWFWGHEHNLGIYKKYLDLKYGRCLGHSAVPVLKEQDPYESLNAIGALPEVTAGTELPLVGNVYAHGFAMLALGANGQAKVDYFNRGAGSQPFFSETIE